MKNLMKKIRGNKKGFTLAELLVVVAIVGILVAISIPVFTAQLGKARRATNNANLRAAKAAAVKIQGVERNRLAAGACVKMRGSVSDVKAAMEAALDVARPLTKIVSHTVIASPSEDTEKAIAMTINK